MYKFCKRTPQEQVKNLQPILCVAEWGFVNRFGSIQNSKSGRPLLFGFKLKSPILKTLQGASCFKNILKLLGGNRILPFNT